jgi:hypothetical protein
MSSSVQAIQNAGRWLQSIATKKDGISARGSFRSRWAGHDPLPRLPTARQRPTSTRNSGDGLKAKRDTMKK